MKTVINQYKDKAFDILKFTYPNINDDKIISFLNDKCKVAESRKLNAHIRNIYKYIYDDIVDPNYIPLTIQEHNLNILSNGYLTENWNPVSTDIIIDWMDKRDIYKKQMLDAKAAGETDKVIELNNKQNKVKANTNSIYGSATMTKTVSFTSNIDMGGAITSQARNFISEQVWAIERFLGKNYSFININEVFSWTDKLFKIKNEIGDEFDSLVNKYIEYIPTISDCIDKFISMVSSIRGMRRHIVDIEKQIANIFTYCSERERIAFYYSNDPIVLIDKNIKIRNLVHKIIIEDIEFINPYKIPGELKDDIELFVLLMKKLCFATIITTDRVIKYNTFRRNVCVVGDTDSTMPSIYEIVIKTLDLFNLHHLMENSTTEIRLVMTYVTVISDLLNETCINFCKCCNAYDENERFFMKMKNEFFFPILLLFMVKKNYIGIQTIQEGKMLPPEEQVAIIGRALGSSTLNEYVSNNINTLLVDKVLRAKQYDPIEVLQGVNDIKTHIIQSIEDGDISFGIKARYNGLGVKDPEGVSIVRSSCIWNEIYPTDIIAPGDLVYSFDTSLNTEENLNDHDIPSDIKEVIRDKIFHNNNSLKMDFARFGLKSICIPAYGDIKKIPKWLIPYININSLVEKHLQPIVALYPSLLIPTSRYVVQGSSVKKMGSSQLINF